jgi:hypothetical protein
MAFVLDTDFTLFLKGASNNNTLNSGDCALLIDITRLQRLEIQGRIGKFRFNGDAHTHFEGPQFEKVFTATFQNNDHESLEMVRMFDPRHILKGVLTGTSISNLPTDIYNMVSSHLGHNDIHHSLAEENIKYPQGFGKKKSAKLLRAHREAVYKKTYDKLKTIKDLADFKENSERMKVMKASAKASAKDAKAKGVTKKRRSKKTKKRNSLYRKR